MKILYNLKIGINNLQKFKKILNKIKIFFRKFENVLKNLRKFLETEKIFRKFKKICRKIEKILLFLNFLCENVKHLQYIKNVTVF